jgi:hypothetical protein
MVGACYRRRLQQNLSKVEDITISRAFIVKTPDEIKGNRIYLQSDNGMSKETGSGLNF